MKLDFKCIIIGAGVSGMTSAIYLKRAGIDCLVIEKEYVGGQINKTYTITNYPGFKEIDGPTLASKMSDQLKELNVPIVYEKVLDVIDNGHNKVVKTNKNEYTSNCVIISAGKTERKLGLINENELAGHGISWCATCDGNFFKNDDVAVVGGGNTAMEDVLYLSRICHKVYLINRTNNFRADNILLEEVKKLENVDILTNCVVETLLLENNKLQGIVLNNDKKIKISGLFEAIGSETKLDFINNLNINIDSGFIVVDSKMQTNIAGIYACGDVIKKDLYQIVTAASDGAIAANSVKNMLK